MCCKDATPAARVSAANAILDRGWGKATQPLENGGDGPLEMIIESSGPSFFRKARMRILPVQSKRT
jgi:hypothetical protein